jgi:uncharacterized membrane protein
MAKRRWTNEEVAEYRKTHDGFGYVNKEDSRIIVPKSYGLGFTFNWGNPLAYVAIVALLVAVVFIKLLFLK